MINGMAKKMVVGIKAYRDMTADTYGSDIIITKWEIAYTANTFSLHN